MERDHTEIAFRRELANAVRFLAIDAVEKAKSGHPGAPMGMADIAEVLWRQHLKHNPKNPAMGGSRPLRALSNGHGSMLLYSLLHLTGYDLPMEDNCKNFRQLHSAARQPGTRKWAITPGVETTTGPARPGSGQCRRHGALPKSCELAAHVQPAGVATTSSTITPGCSSATVV